MPPQKAAASFAAAMGNRLDGVLGEVKGVPVTMGNTRLPGGIKNGVAQVISCKLAQFADDVKDPDLKGKWYFMARATVKRPVMHEGVKTEGMQTQIGPEPLCDTPRRSRKTVKDHLIWIRDRLARIGIDTSKMSGAAALETLCKAVEASKPHITFHTFVGSKQVIVNKGGKFFVENENGRGASKGPYSSEEAAKKANPYVGSEPLVNEDWDGPYEWTDDDAAEVADEVSDNTSTSAVEPSENGVGHSAPADEVEGGYTDQGDLDSLAELAGAGDQEAIDKLKAFVVEIGGTEEDVENAPDWATVLEWIRAGAVPAAEGDEQGEAEDGSAAEEADPWADLKKGDVVGYKPLLKGPGGKTVQAKRKVDCKVEAVNKTARKCDIKNMTDGKTVYKGVSFDDLEQV